MHSNDRPHSCPYCVSTFKRAYVLKNHIKQHIGVKGYNYIIHIEKDSYISFSHNISQININLCIVYSIE